MAILTDEIRSLLAGRSFVHLATLRADGSPRSWIVWVDLEDDKVLVCTGLGSWKAKDMQRDARVSLSVADRDNPYRMAALQGRVVEVRDDADSRYMNPISVKYTGQPFPVSGPGRVCFVIEVLKAGSVTLGFSDA